MTLDLAARAGLGLLADASIRGLLLCGIAAALLTICRVQRAADRLALWRVVIVVALVMPALTMVIPGVNLLVPTFGLPLSTAAPTAGSIVGANKGVFFLAADGVASGFAAATAAFLIYFVGVLWLLARLALASYAAGRAARHANPITDPAVTDRVAALSARLGSVKLPRLVESANTDVPLTSGALRRTIVLPAGWTTWPPDMLDAVLLHELAHVTRRDVLTQQLALLLRAIFWPSPLGWWLRRHVSSLAERASDDVALSAGIEPVRYAHILATFLGAVSRRPHRAGTLAMARPPLAERRVERILEWTRSCDMSLSKHVRVLLVLATFAGVWLAAALRPVPVSANAAIASMPSVGSALYSLLLAAGAAASAATTGEGRKTGAASAPATAPTSAVKGDESIGTGTGATSTSAATASSNAAASAATTTVVGMGGFVPNDDFAAGAYSAKTQGLTLPVLLRDVKPRYTSNAMKQKIQGQVIVQAIVDADGVVRRARTIQSLTPELDEQALAAVREWLFRSGTLGGRAVPVSVVLVLEFKLH